MTTADENNLIANAALTGILVFPLFFLWLFSCTQTQTRKDPVRNGVHWLRLAFPFFLLSLVMTVAADALDLVILFGDDGTTVLFQAANYVSLVSGFLEMTATVLSLVALVEVSLGFLSIYKPPASAAVKPNGTPADPYKTLHIALAVVSGLLLVLAVALLGKACSAYANYYRDYSDSDANYTAIINTYQAAIKVVRDLGATFDILVWVLTFPLVSVAGYLVHLGRAQSQPSVGAAVLLLLATLLWCVRFTWHLAYNAAWLLPSGSPGVPRWFDVADPLLNAWTFFVVLVLLYVLLARRARGLWSTAQPWTQQAPQYQPVYQPRNPADPVYAAPPAGYVQAPVSGAIYQMAANEQPQRHLFHEMPPNSLQGTYAHVMHPPANPQELYTPQHYVQQYHGHPQGTPSQVPSHLSSQPTGSTATGASPPPNDVKA